MGNEDMQAAKRNRDMQAAKRGCIPVTQLMGPKENVTQLKGQKGNGVSSKARLKCATAKGTKGKCRYAIKGPKGNGDMQSQARLKCATYRRN